MYPTIERQIHLLNLETTHYKDNMPHDSVHLKQNASMLSVFLPVINAKFVSVHLVLLFEILFVYLYPFTVTFIIPHFNLFVNYCEKTYFQSQTKHFIISIFCAYIFLFHITFFTFNFIFFMINFFFRMRLFFDIIDLNIYVFSCNLIFF